MKFFTRIAVLFYVATITTIGVLMIFIAYRIDSPLIEQVTYDLNVLRGDDQLRGIVAIAGLLAILLSIMCSKIISGAQQKERTIAFDNPSGRVTISLFAMEDMVKRLTFKEPDIKEVRSNIIATKRGLEVEARLVLKADVNIPEITARLQDLIKEKFQEMIGIEEKIIVRIHIMKISTEDVKQKKRSDYPEKPETTIPFQGYRA